MVRVRTFIVLVWLWEGLGVISLLSWYRLEDKQDVWEFLSHLDGKVFLAAASLFLCTGALVAWNYVALKNHGLRLLRSIATWNILPLMLIIVLAEGSLRALSTETPSGTMLGKLELGPRRLDTTIRNPQVADDTFSYDHLLGWIVKPDLNQHDHLYSTSAAGVRSSQQGSLSASSPAVCRVALVGDSHTFGQELKLGDTWADQLESSLRKGCQVLNFGVPGYSVGQMYLRYLRDVRPWHPDVTVLALSSHSSARTMGVYGLNMFPQSIPWAQPRFQLKDHELIPINVPLPTLDEIAAARWMNALPFIGYDWFFVPGKWELPRWRYLYHSYLFRLYTSWFPLWRTDRHGDSDQAINHELLRSFLRTAKSDGSTPLVLYLPDKNDYREPGDQEMPSLIMLRTSNITFFDLRPCLNEVDAGNRFIPRGGHYSRSGSIEIARCVVARLPPRLLEHSPSPAAVQP